MGLSIEVGFLADLKRNDREGFKGALEEFRRVNEALRRRGLVPHPEPQNLDEKEIYSADLYGYSGVHFLRRIAANIFLNGKVPASLPRDGDPTEDLVLKSHYKTRTPDSGKRKSNWVRPATLAFDHLIHHSDAEGMYIPIPFDPPITATPAEKFAGGFIGSSIVLLEECRQLASALKLPEQMSPEHPELTAAIENVPATGAGWRAHPVAAYVCLHLLRASKRSIELKAAIVFT